MKTTFGRIVAVAALVTGMGSASMAQEYPYRDITTAVVWGAGGGTDSINRMIMAEMERHLSGFIRVRLFSTTERHKWRKVSRSIASAAIPAASNACEC